MKIYYRYLLREMVVPFLIGQAAIVMMLTGSVLYNNANIFLQNQVPMVYVIRIALYFIPFLVHMTMPVAMAVATSLAVSRLGRDSEITVMRASGMSLARIFFPIFVAGLLVSIGDFYFGETVVPASINRFIAVMSELPTHMKRQLAPPGQWIVSYDQQSVLRVQSMVAAPDHVQLYNITIVSDSRAVTGSENETRVIASPTGQYRDGKWTLDRTTVYVFNLRNPNWSRAVSGRTEFYIPVDAQAFQSSFILQLPMGTMAQSATRTFKQLGEDMARNRRFSINDSGLAMDYHFKLSVPFSCLVMALCCAPIALRFSRGGGFMGTLLSICVVFVYWNTLLLARILGTSTEGMPPLLAPHIAAWSQNVLFVVLGLIVLKRSE